MLNIFKLLAVCTFFQLVYGTSPPVFLPPVICKEGEVLCGRNCFVPSEKQCLKYSDGSGGTVCDFNESFCGGRCYDATSDDVCASGQSGYQVICKAGQSVCSFANCYNANESDCIDGKTLCPKGQILCGFGGNSCYLPSEDVECIKGSWQSYLCRKGEQLCNNVCYNPETQACIENQISSL